MRRDQWLQAEGANWLAALRHAATAGEHATVVEVAEAMHWFSDQWICWGHWPEICRTATHSAQALGDPLLEATQLNYRASPCSCATAATIIASPARPRPSPPRNAPTTWPSRHGPTTTPPGLFDGSATTRQPASTTPERPTVRGRRGFPRCSPGHGRPQSRAVECRPDRRSHRRPPWHAHLPGRGWGPKAVAHLQTAVDLSRDSGNTGTESHNLIYLGNALLAAGHPNQARQAFTSCLSLVDADPQSTAEAREQLARLDTP